MELYCASGVPTVERGNADATTWTTEVPLVLTAEETETLERWARRPKTAQALAQRARIVLACAAGTPNDAVAPRVRVTRQTVGKWRARFVAKRLDGLLDEPRPGAPRTVTDAAVERVITGRSRRRRRRDALEYPGDGAGRRAQPESTVSRIWRAFALQPHRGETFKLSTDPLFIDKVRDIVGLYLHPPDKALVLCVDEKAQIQALDRTQPLLPMRPGQVERRTHDYVRHGTTSLFAALDVESGHVIGDCHRRHRAVEFRKFLDTIDAAVPAALDVHLILDNYEHPQSAADPALAGPASSRPPALHADQRVVDQSRRAVVRRPHRQAAPPRRAPQHAPARGGDPPVPRRHNERPKPFVWTKTADEILASVARFCHRISDSGH